MGSKVVTIEPDFAPWRAVTKKFKTEEPIQVIFTWSKPKLERGRRNQTVTTCIMRQGVNPIGVGWAIENPNDEPNHDEGIHWAFKRAVRGMIKALEKDSRANFSQSFQRQIDKTLRRALWEAMND